MGTPRNNGAEIPKNYHLRLSEDYQSDNYQTDDDESEWEDEERDHDAIDLALWLVGQSP